MIISIALELLTGLTGRARQWVTGGPGKSIGVAAGVVILLVLALWLGLSAIRGGHEHETTLALNARDAEWQAKLADARAAVVSEANRRMDAAARAAEREREVWLTDIDAQAAITARLEAALTAARGPGKAKSVAYPKSIVDELNK